MIDITTQAGLFQLFTTVLVPVVTGAVYCAIQYKSRALASGEEFSSSKFYLTEGVAVLVGAYAFFIGGVPLSNVDLVIQVGYYGGVIVAAENLLKIVFRWFSQSPKLVNALGGVPTDKSETVAAINTPAAAGGIEIAATPPGTPVVVTMPEGNFKWMCKGHTQADIVDMKSQVMAAEAAGMTHYYVSYKDRSGGVYRVLNGEVYGSGDPATLPPPITDTPPIQAAPGAVGYQPPA